MGRYEFIRIRDESGVIANVSLNGKTIHLGSFKTKELAEEAKLFFKNECNKDVEKYKQSKYWRELRNLGSKSEEHVRMGTIVKKDSRYEALCKSNHQCIRLGSFETKELAQEAINYFLNECNEDFNKYKQSKYWAERNDRRSASKSYWEKGHINSKNTSGVTGVSWIEPQKLWRAEIHIGGARYIKKFKSKENAIKYRNFLAEQGKKFNVDWDEKRKQEQMKLIKEQSEKLAQDLKQNNDEKEAST